MNGPHPLDPVARDLMTVVSHPGFFEIRRGNKAALSALTIFCWQVGVLVREESGTIEWEYADTAGEALAKMVNRIKIAAARADSDRADDYFTEITAPIEMLRGEEG